MAENPTEYKPMFRAVVSEDGGNMAQLLGLYQVSVGEDESQLENTRKQLLDNVGEDIFSKLKMDFSSGDTNHCFWRRSVLASVVDWINRQDENVTTEEIDFKEDDSSPLTTAWRLLLEHGLHDPHPLASRTARRGILGMELVPKQVLQSLATDESEEVQEIAVQLVKFDRIEWTQLDKDTISTLEQLLISRLNPRRQLKEDREAKEGADRDAGEEEVREQDEETKEKLEDVIDLLNTCLQFDCKLSLHKKGEVSEGVRLACFRALERSLSNIAMSIITTREENIVQDILRHNGAMLYLAYNDGKESKVESFKLGEPDFIKHLQEQITKINQLGGRISRQWGINELENAKERIRVLRSVIAYLMEKADKEKLVTAKDMYMRLGRYTLSLGGGGSFRFRPGSSAYRKRSAAEEEVLLSSDLPDPRLGSRFFSDAGIEFN